MFQANNIVLRDVFYAALLYLAINVIRYPTGDLELHEGGPLDDREGRLHLRCMIRGDFVCVVQPTWDFASVRHAPSLHRFLRRHFLELWKRQAPLLLPIPRLRRFCWCKRNR